MAIEYADGRPRPVRPPEWVLRWQARHNAMRAERAAPGKPQHRLAGGIRLHVASGGDGPARCLGCGGRPVPDGQRCCPHCGQVTRAYRVGR